MPQKNLKKHLAEALLANNAQRAIEILVHNPFIVNSSLHEGKAALHLAVDANNEPLVKFIVGLRETDLNKLTSKHKTAVYLACANSKISINILNSLLSKKANPGIPDETGETPLAAACWNGDTAKCEALLKAGVAQCNPNAICVKHGSTALTNAVTNKQLNIVKLIIAVIDIKIINHKNNSGESALFIAAKLGLVEFAAFLIEIPGIDFDACRAVADGKTAAEIAKENGHTKIAEMIHKKKLNVANNTRIKAIQALSHHVDLNKIAQDTTVTHELKLDAKGLQQTKSKQLVTDYPSYTRYLRTLKKFPNSQNFIDYLQELLAEILKNKAKPILAVKSEVEDIRSRQTWSNVISETYAENAKYIVKNKIQAAIIKRLQNLGFKKNTHLIYQCCIDYLKYNSAIVIAFKANFIHKGVQDFQVLNMFQRNISRGSSYTTDRDKAERGMFSYLSAALKKQLFEQAAARPKYAALMLLDRDQPVAPVDHYGKSFIVLKDSVKFNSLFSPYDSLDSKTETGVDVVPCTYHHFDILLHQCHDKFLHAIATRVTTGLLPDDFYQQVHRVNHIADGCYVEVLLPSIDVSMDYIEHIHIDASEYAIPKTEVDALHQIKFSITNSNENPYLKIAKNFMSFLEKNDIKNVKIYLKAYPSLAHISNRMGFEPLHIAAQHGYNEIVKALLDSGANVNALAPDGKAVIHIAIKNKNHDLITILLNHRDIDINIRMNIPNDAFDGGTPLHLACMLDIKIFTLLVNKKADLCLCTTSGMTILMLTPFVEVVDIMQSTRGATTINNKNAKGEFALYIAASKGEVIKVQALLRFRSINAEAKHQANGFTAAEIAKRNKHHYSANLIKCHIDSKKNPLELKTTPPSNIYKIKLAVLKNEFNKEFNNPLTFQNDLIKNIINMFKLLENSVNVKNPAEIILGFILTERAKHTHQNPSMFQASLYIKKLERVKANYIKELKSHHPSIPLSNDLDCINIYKAYKKNEPPSNPVLVYASSY